MKNLIFILALSITFILGCSQDEGVKIDCISSTLEEFSMTEYNDQEIECKSFFVLYEYQNKQYFLLGNHCADMISYPIDCEGNVLCEFGEDLECKLFYLNSTRIGIIGIRE